MENMISLAGELTLDDEGTAKVLLCLNSPPARKCAIPSTIVGVEKRFYGLAKVLPSDGEAQLLEATPPKLM